MPRCNVGCATAPSTDAPGAVDAQGAGKRLHWPAQVCIEIGVIIRKYLTSISTYKNLKTKAQSRRNPRLQLQLFPGYLTLQGRHSGRRSAGSSGVLSEAVHRPRKVQAAVQTCRHAPRMKSLTSSNQCRGNTVQTASVCIDMTGPKPSESNSPSYRSAHGLAHIPPKIKETRRLIRNSCAADSKLRSAARVYTS